MKKYQEVKMEAKNAPTGSYAAGCPTGTRVGNGSQAVDERGRYVYCRDCEVAA